MHKTSLLIAAVAISFPALASAAPDWCKPLAGKSGPSVSPETMTDESDARKATQAVVSTICTPRDPADVPKAEEARKKWSTLLEMNDADWAAAAEYVAKYDQYEGAPKPNKKEFAGLDALDQYLLIYGANSQVDAYYIADAASPLSETGRLAFAMWCVRNEIGKEAHVAACMHDVAAVDLKKISDELHADKSHEPRVTYMARTKWYEHKQMFADFQAKAEKLKKDDPAYAQMFDIADKAWKTWESNVGKRAKLISLAAEMDNMRETGSRKAQAGCEDKTVASLLDAVSDIPAERFASVVNVEGLVDVSKEVGKDLVATPEGYLGANAFVNCMMPGLDYNSDIAFFVQTLGNAMLRWPGYRGPRSASMSDIMQAGLQPDQRDKEIGYPSFSRYFLGNDRALMSNDYKKSAIATIASVKVAGKAATLTFEKKKVSYATCVDYKAGTKITGIMANGQFERAGTCYKYKDVTDMQAVDPKPADARFVKGLKPGQRVVSVNLVPYASWGNKAKAPATILGVPVK